VEAVETIDDERGLLLRGPVARRAFLQKALGLGLSLSAAEALFLAACGGEDEASKAAPKGSGPDLEGVTLRISKAPHGEREKEYFEEWLAPFKERTGVQIEHTITPWDQVEAAYTANFASDDPFDVTYQVSTHLTLFGARGAFEDLTDRFDASKNAAEKKHFVPQVVEGATWRGRLYGIPYTIGSEILYANEDLLAEAGVKGPTTTDEVIEVAKQLASPPDHWGFYAPTTVKDFGWHFNLHNVKNLGGDIMSSDNETPTIFSDPVIQATQYAADLLLEHKVQPPVGTYDREGAIQLFAAGKLALLLDEPFRYTVFKEEGLPFKWSTYQPPGAPDGKQTTYSPISHWCISAKGKQKDASWELVKYLTGPEFSKVSNAVYSFIPVRDDVDLSDVVDPPIQKQIEFTQANWDGMRTHPKILQMLDEYTKALEAATTGTKSVEEALKQAQARAEAILA
jgi:ABC-type glycerol-3-phosphate transport system substrate-binding protein